jgi:sec-independent protein translocase protein TatA
MGIPGGVEWLLILAIVVLIFGGKKIPELMKGVGSGIKNFKKAVKDDDEKLEITDSSKERTDEKVATASSTESLKISSEKREG